MSSPNDFARLVSQGRRKDEQVAKLRDLVAQFQREREVRIQIEVELRERIAELEQHLVEMSQAAERDFDKAFQEGKALRIAEFEQRVIQVQLEAAESKKAIRADEREQIARQILVVREMSPDLPEKKGWEDACDAMLNMLED